MADLTLDEQGALAASMFPREWARVAGQTGARAVRARRNLRKRALYQAAMIPLRAAGANCGACRHFGKVPNSKDRCCDLDSDFHGYAIRSANDLCPHYAGRP